MIPGMSRREIYNLSWIAYSRIILKETGLNRIVPVSHMNDHGSHNIRILDIKNIFQK